MTSAAREFASWSILAHQLLYLRDMTPAGRWLGLAALAVLPATPAFAAPVDIAYLHDLSDFTGRIPYSDARVVADVPRSEVYAVYGNEIRVFNTAGMETYRFEVDFAVGRVVDLGIEGGGDMLILAYASGAGEGTQRWSLIRADYRGRPTGEVGLDRSGDAAGLLPNRLLLRQGRIWLVSLGQMRAACYLPDGKLERILDLGKLAGLAEKDRGNAEIGGLDVAGDGTIVFAVPVQFRVHAIDPGGGIRSFGRSGSAAGNFGILGDVAVDGEGNIFLSDRQRSVVMIFTREFRFLHEAGRTSRNGWLARPGALAIDPGGRLYVSQMRSLGIAVFGIAMAP